MCEDMKYEPMEETISSSLAMDTRSILRVPSLNSSTSTPSSRPNNLSEHEGRSSMNSIGIVDYTGSPLHQQATKAHPAKSFLAAHQHGPPAYVNYRPEEMNLTPEGWQFSSKYNVQGNWPGTNGLMPPQNVVEMGQHIRIRSSRGAPRRLSLNSSINNSPSSITRQLDEPSTVTVSSSSRGFPVSNRGMGRRTVVVTSSVATKGLPSDRTNDEVVMLTNLKKTTVSASEDLPEKSNESKFPRSVLKRKLPLMVQVVTDEVANSSD